MIIPYELFSLMIILLELLFISGLILFMRRERILKNKAIVAGFLVFSLLVGIWSFEMGKKDIVIVLNFPASEISERVYNNYLIPYWQNTLEPVGYEEIPIRDLRTGDITGTERVPQYDFPVKDVKYLFIPASLLSWGLSGLIIQLIYNRRIHAS